MNPAASDCCIISAMSSRFFLSLVALSLLGFQQSTDPNAAHIKEWTERHAHYLSEPKIEETDSWREITANDPRPLENVLDAFARQHGWHINYEDPLYGKADIVDNTAPSWLKGPSQWSPRIHGRGWRVLRCFTTHIQISFGCGCTSGEESSGGPL